MNSLTGIRALGHVQATIAITKQMTDSPKNRSPQEFVDQHLQSVWRYLRMHGAGPHEADDLAQEAFVTALQKGALNFDPPAAQVFLRRAARFAFLHHLRDRRHDPELADAVDDLWDREAADDGGELLLRELHGCIDKLEGRAQQAIRWSYGIGEDAEDSRGDVAKRMNLKPNGLKTLLQRTRQLLRTCIESATR
ncbi:MAG: RNA polymerase sigma factor (sigma-70 family) [Planctomycetota bacterium]